VSSIIGLRLRLLLIPDEDGEIIEEKAKCRLNSMSYLIFRRTCKKRRKHGETSGFWGEGGRGWGTGQRGVNITSSSGEYMTNHHRKQV
jgi:hypothetical protein